MCLFEMIDLADMLRRFRSGRWKSLRVIEPPEAVFEDGAAEPA